MWKSPEPGEGEWVVPEVPWLRRVPGVAADAPSPFYRTFVRPDEERPYARVLLVAMDLRQLDFQMEAGVEDPEPLTGPHGFGRIPRDPLLYRRVAAAFNGAFKTEHGHYGMMVHKRVLLPPVPGSATVVVLGDGRVGFGTWGSDRSVGGIAGVGDDEIDSFRQNLDPLIDRGQVNPTGRNLWGFTLPGKGAQTERTGLCVTASSHLLYAWGDDLSASSLAKAMKMAGCDYAMHLDMNPYHTGFIFMAVDDLSGNKYRSQLLTTAMSIPADRYIQYAPKDFFYVLVHDPTPPAVGGGAPWAADDGAQPPPRWMPGIWRTQLDGPEGSVELMDVEPGRATWRVRAGATRCARGGAAPGARGGRVAPRGPRARPWRGARSAAPRARDRRSAGGRRARRGGLGSAVRRGGRAARDRARGRRPGPRRARRPRRAPDRDLGGPRGVVLRREPSPRARPSASPPAGRVLVARGEFSSAAPLAEALARAGCTRAVSLDRGVHATAFIDRAGTSSPPRSRYDESVLYAIGAPLRPKGFRFEASTPVAQAAKAK